MAETETLLALALDKASVGLEARVASEQVQDVGIFRHEGIPYIYHLTWHKHKREYDFLLEVIQVTPNVRKDRKPKTELVASRQFTERI